MLEQHFDELTERATDTVLGEFPALQEAASVAVRGELEAMQVEDKVLILSEEEERMIRSFRRFKSKMRKPDEVFRWQTARDPSVILPEPEVLIQDPQEGNPVVAMRLFGQALEHLEEVMAECKSKL